MNECECSSGGGPGPTSGRAHLVRSQRFAEMTSYHVGSFPGSLPGLYPMVPGRADRENEVMRVDAAAGAKRVAEHHGGVVEGAVQARYARSTVKFNLATHVRLRSTRAECQQ